MHPYILFFLKLSFYLLISYKPIPFFFFFKFFRIAIYHFPVFSSPSRSCLRLAQESFLQEDYHPYLNFPLQIYIFSHELWEDMSLIFTSQVRCFSHRSFITCCLNEYSASKWTSGKPQCYSFLNKEYQKKPQQLLP